MNWIRSILKNKNQEARTTSSNKQSDEISDIVERMPMTFGRWVAIAVVIFSLFLLIFGWIIKYPDSVVGQIQINSDNAPIKLVANSSGKIKLLRHKAQDQVKEGDYIAVIQNPAVTENMRLVDSLLNSFDPNQDSLSEYKEYFPDKVSLGNLNMDYYSFLSAFKNQYDYQIANIYDIQIKNIEDDIKWKRQLLKNTNDMLSTNKERMEISEKWHEKDISLTDNKVMAEYELDNSKNNLLSSKYNLQALNKEISSVEMQISSSNNELQKLRVEKNEKEKELLMTLLSSYYSLRDKIKQWEQQFVLVAPFDGKVEFLKFLYEDQFIQAGEEIFSIVPQENIMVGQMLLPAIGAGKVKVGNRVIIKLDNYPYLEFGSISGSVKSISLTTQQYKSEQTTLNTYLVTVELPHGLITNYGDTLDFKYELAGNGNIVVRERRLIERLFDNLRYNTK